MAWKHFCIWSRFQLLPKVHPWFRIPPSPPAFANPAAGRPSVSRPRSSPAWSLLAEPQAKAVRRRLGEGGPCSAAWDEKPRESCGSTERAIASGEGARAGGDRDVCRSPDVPWRIRMGWCEAAATTRSAKERLGLPPRFSRHRRGHDSRAYGRRRTTSRSLRSRPPATARGHAARRLLVDPRRVALRSRRSPDHAPGPAAVDRLAHRTDAGDGRNFIPPRSPPAGSAKPRSRPPARRGKYRRAETPPGRSHPENRARAGRPRVDDRLCAAHKP